MTLRLSCKAAVPCCNADTSDEPVGDYDGPVTSGEIGTVPLGDGGTGPITLWGFSGALSGRLEGEGLRCSVELLAEISRTIGR